MKCNKCRIEIHLFNIKSKWIVVNNGDGIKQLDFCSTCYNQPERLNELARKGCDSLNNANK